MFKPLMAVGIAGLALIALEGCARRPPPSGSNLALLQVRQDTLAENEQASLVYRRNDWSDAPGEPVTYIYEGPQSVLAGEPALIELELIRAGRPRTYCGVRFSFVPARGRSYQVNPAFEGDTCSARLIDLRTGRTPDSYHPMAAIEVKPLPEVPVPDSVEWED